MSTHAEFHDMIHTVEARLRDALSRTRESCFNTKSEIDALHAVAAMARLLAAGADEFATYLEKQPNVR